MNAEDTAKSTGWALSAHLLGIFGTYLVPFGNILGPMVIWLIKKEEDSFVARHAVAAMNFQITVTLALIACIPLLLVVVGLPLMIIIGIGQLVLGIIATVAAGSGKEYEYPFTLHLVNG